MEKGFTIQCNVCGETVTLNDGNEDEELKITVGCYWDHETNFKCKNCGQQIVV